MQPVAAGARAPLSGRKFDPQVKLELEAGAVVTAAGTRSAASCPQADAKNMAASPATAIRPQCPKRAPNLLEPAVIDYVPSWVR